MISQMVWEFSKAQYLPLGLVVSMSLGVLWPAPGVWLGTMNFSAFCTTAIFFISGLMLEKGEAVKAVASWGSLLYGLISILVLTPLTALIAQRLPIQPPELALGLAIFMLTPTTLSSGVTLTQVVGGNVAMAVLLTIVSNLMGIFTVPFTLPLVLGDGVSGGVALSSTKLLRALIQTVLIPAVIGYMARASNKDLDAWVSGRKKKLSLLSSALLVAVPWMQISLAVENGIYLTPLAIVLATTLGSGIHVLCLVFNVLMVGYLGLGGASRDTGICRAVILVSSQKTLLMSVTILAQLTGVLGPTVGLAIISCVLAHLGQLVIDSALVSSWMKNDRKSVQPS